MRKLKITEQITNRDDISVSAYLNDLSAFGLLDREAEHAVATKACKGDQQAINKLVNANLRFVITIAKQWQNHGLPLADLISEGNLGLIEAAKRFDPEKGFKFISYAVWWIRQSILSALMEHKQQIRLPVKVQTLIADMKALKAQDELISEEDIAVRLNINRDRLNEVIHAPGYAQTSVYLPEEGVLFNMVDIHPDDQPPVDETLDPDEHKLRVRRFLNLLSPRDRKIMEMSFGIGAYVEKTNVDIAREVDLTPEMVRVVISRSLKNMRKAHDARPV